MREILNQNISKYLVRFFIVGLGLLLAGCADLDDELLAHDLKKMPQSNLEFIKAQDMRSIANANQLAITLKSQYLHYYYSPWDNPTLFHDVNYVRNDVAKSIGKYVQQPGWDANRQLHSVEWALNIKANMNLANFPNTRRKAITARDTNLRALPTDSPSFVDWDAPGQGYPFDTIQTSYLTANLPLYVLHTTRNGIWKLVITPYNSYGWVKSSDIAYVNKKFIKTFKSKKFIVTLKDNQAIFNDRGHYVQTTRYGKLFPLAKEGKVNYKVLIAIRSKNAYAHFEVANLSKKYARLWPVLINKKTIAKFADSMLNQPYGWGEMYGYRDCSGTIQDLFIPFAIWLPRNTYDQAHSKAFVDLSALTNLQKIEKIKQRGDPFLTLLWMPGHMMLYLGVKNGRVFVFHDPWGIRINDGSGRVVIGRTIITPVDLAKGYFNVVVTFLDKIQGMAILVPASK